MGGIYVVCQGQIEKEKGRIMMAVKQWKHPSVRALMSTEPKQRAKLVVAIKGKFTRWRAGQVVMAQKIGRDSYAIERLRWRTPKLELTNRLAGVPKVALKFL